MHAWLCESLTGVDGLRWAELPTPEPGAGEIRVAIKAASLNFPDLLTVKGQYQFKPPMPFVPGSEFSGVVEAVGAGVTNVAPGQRVAVVTTMGGGFATHAKVPAQLAVPLPPTIGFEDAAAFVMTYGTSYHGLLDRGSLKAGETLLVLGAAGGVGTAAIQIGKAVGARVVAAVSTPEKAAFCTGLGADATIVYGSGNVRDAIKAATDGKGPDVVYDPVGGDLAEPVFRSIGWRGRYLVVGFAQGGIPSLPLNLMLLKGAAVLGVFWGDFLRREPAAAAADLKQLAEWHAQGRIKPAIDLKLPMSRIREAYERMGTRQVMGKVLLVDG